MLAPRASENIAVAIKEKVPVINYSLGKPWFIEQVHQYGGKVIGTVAIARHALHAKKLGCDIIIVTGHEAAAHGADATSMVLIPIIASQVNVPLIAAGGFFDGRGLAAALVLGADAISMGTRFIITKESDVHENFKQLCLKATEQDTIYSDLFDGMPGRALKSRATEVMLKGGFSVLGSIKNTLELKRLLNLSIWELIRQSRKMKESEEGLSLLLQARQASSAIKHLKAIKDGDIQQGFLFAGQSVGGITDIPTCEELIKQTVKDAEVVLKKAGAMMF